MIPRILLMYFCLKTNTFRSMSYQNEKSNFKISFNYCISAYESIQNFQIGTYSKTINVKGKASLVPSLRNTASLKKFEFLCPFSKALRKLTKSHFALDQLYIELKTKSLFSSASKCSNVLPFKYKC